MSNISDRRDFWERTAERFGENGIRAVCTPTAVGWLNKYADLLQRTCLTSYLANCRGLVGLDAGCGVGRWTSRLLDYGAEVIGIDISRKMLLQAKKRLSQRRQGGEFIVSSVSNMPFKDNVFDFCLNVTVLEHIIEDDDFKRAVCEIARVIKERDNALVLEVSPQTSKPTSSDFPTAFRSTQDWISAFEENRLKIKRIRGVELGLFLRPLFAAKKKFFRNAGLYVQQCQGKTLPLRITGIKVMYYFLINLAIIFSLPLDLGFRDIFKNHSSHKLFVLDKI